MSVPTIRAVENPGYKRMSAVTPIAPAPTVEIETNFEWYQAIEETANITDANHPPVTPLPRRRTPIPKESAPCVESRERRRDRHRVARDGGSWKTETLADPKTPIAECPFVRPYTAFAVLAFFRPEAFAAGAGFAAFAFLRALPSPILLASSERCAA
jgi:hypothetical protein